MRTMTQMQIETGQASNELKIVEIHKLNFFQRFMFLIFGAQYLVKKGLTL